MHYQESKARNRSLEERTFFKHIPKEDLDIFVRVITISRMKQCNSTGVILKWQQPEYLAELLRS